MDSIHFSRKSPRWNSPEHTKRLLAVFSESERARYDRLSTERQAEYLQSRCLLRYALSKQHGLPFDHWNLVERPNHSPALDNQGINLYISLSHSKQFLACALSKTPVGIDIDEPRPIPNLSKIAKRVFTPSQQAELAEAKEQDREALFLRCWSQKEAIFKACTGAETPIQFMSQQSAVGTGFASAHTSTKKVYGAIASQQDANVFTVIFWNSPAQCRQVALPYTENRD